MSSPPFALFSGTSHRKLSEEIAEKLGVRLGKAHIELFPDGEIGAQILENVRGRDVFAMQSIAKRPNFYLMELLILIDALKRASARSITAVIPYFGYARQDRKDKGRVPITAKLVANMLETAGVARVITMDLHSEQIQGFFDIPVDNLYAQSLFVEEIQRMGVQNPVVCAPDVGSIKLAHRMAGALNASFALVDKERIGARAVKVRTLIGSVQGRDVILVDDICSTGMTLVKASEALKEVGAARVLAVATHPLFSREVAEQLPVAHLLVTNTIPLPTEIDHSQLTALSVADVFGEAINCVLRGSPIPSQIAATSPL